MKLREKSKERVFYLELNEEELESIRKLIGRTSVNQRIEKYKMNEEVSLDFTTLYNEIGNLLNR